MGKGLNKHRAASCNVALLLHKQFNNRAMEQLSNEY